MREVTKEQFDAFLAESPGFEVKDGPGPERWDHYMVEGETIAIVTYYVDQSITYQIRYNPTQQDIDKLKHDWAADPIWDIEDTEGFADHREELLAYRHEMEARWEQEHRVRLQRNADNWGVDIETARPIEGLDYAATQAQSKASLLLRYYLGMAGVPVAVDGDCAAEIDAIAEQLVDAAVARTKSDLLMGRGK